MARPPSDDPLIPVPVRLPTSLVERLRERADSTGRSLSDVLRSHLTLAEARPLGLPRPRRREPKRLGAVSGADPLLLRELAGLGNNMNQLARSVNTCLIGGAPIERVQILSVLLSIERQLSVIAERHAR
jgi:hypothetical protein